MSDPGHNLQDPLDAMHCSLPSPTLLPSTESTDSDNTSDSSLEQVSSDQQQSWEDIDKSWSPEWSSSPPERQKPARSSASSRISLRSDEWEITEDGHRRPPQDRRKPPLPYTVGKTFSITRHIPPAPIQRVFGHGPKRTMSLKNMTQYEYCVANPAMDGTDVPGERRDITITQQIRVGDGETAQIVRVEEGMVAKIYDPVYYPTIEREYGYKLNNIVYMADTDYRNEANAFEEIEALQAQLDGTITPKYYGSWTLDIAVEGSNCTTRPVRLVLMEYLDGVCMKDLDPTQLTEEERLNIMFKVIEAENTLYHHGISHTDVYPRNVMILSPPHSLSSPDLRVCLIDFNMSTLARLESRIYEGDNKIPKNRYRLPLSPIFRWWGSMDEFQQYGWLPGFNKTGENLANEILWNKYSDSPLYLPVFPNHRGPKYCPVCPEYQKVNDDAWIARNARDKEEKKQLSGFTSNEVAKST